MRPVGTAVIRAGLVDEETLSEIKRWGLPIQVVPRDVSVAEDPDMALRIVQDALESSEQVRVQDTDLDIIKRWIDPSNQVEGKLILRDLEGKRRTLKVRFCWTLMREVAIPWKSESITDLLLDGDAHLQWEQDGEKKCAFFTDARELFIGDTKAFIVCSVEVEASELKK